MHFRKKIQMWLRCSSSRPLHTATYAITWITLCSMKGRFDSPVGRARNIIWLGLGQWLSNTNGTHRQITHTLLLKYQFKFKELIAFIVCNVPYGDLGRTRLLCSSEEHILSLPPLYSNRWQSINTPFVSGALVLECPT